MLFDLEGTSPPFARDLESRTAELDEHSVPEKTTSPNPQVESKGFIGNQFQRTEGIASPTDKVPMDARGVGTAFSPDHRWLATSNRTKTIVVWDLEAKNPAETAVLLEAKGVVTGLAFHPKIPWLFVTCHDPVEMAVDFVS